MLLMRYRTSSKLRSFTDRVINAARTFIEHVGGRRKMKLHSNKQSLVEPELKQKQKSSWESKGKQIFHKMVTGITKMSVKSNIYFILPSTYRINKTGVIKSSLATVPRGEKRNWDKCTEHNPHQLLHKNIHQREPKISENKTWEASKAHVFHPQTIWEMRC